MARLSGQVPCIRLAVSPCSAGIAFIMNEPVDSRSLSIVQILSRFAEALIGLFLGTVVFFCLLGSLFLVFSENAKAPVLASATGVVMTAVSGWLLAICVRLVTGRKRQGGLLTPTSLRVVAVVFLLLPIAGVFTGYFRTHTVQAVLQTVFYVSAFFTLFGLARKRSGRKGSSPVAEKAD